MLGFFPTPYPDELLYSVCARYARRVKYPNREAAIVDLFGKRGLSAVLDFPTRIERLLSVIPHHSYTSDDIIDNHTLLPFYAPFLEPDRAYEVRIQMKELRENRLVATMAKNVRQIKIPEYIRFCPCCIEDDARTYGESYWHRSHQLPGILVCPKHRCFLQDSSIRLGRQSSAFFHSAQQYASPRNPIYLSDKDPTHLTLLQLAENAEWLLDQRNIVLPAGELRRRYYNLLLSRGYAYYNGQIKATFFTRDFNASVPQQALNLLGCTLRSTPPNWISRLFQTNLIDVLHHPIHNLLVMGFLNITPEELFISFNEFKPFGDPPYPCLNSASSHYRELLIETCQVFDNLTKGKKFRGPLGVFSCECGFTYQRKGPDKTPDDRNRFSSVGEYGRTWESALADQWNDTNIPLSQIARNLRTSACLVTRHAIRLDLPMNKEGARSAVGYKRYQNPREQFEERLQKYRNEWLELRKANKKAGRRTLLDESSHLYLWLKRNDTEWFNSTLPDQAKIRPRKAVLDWKAIDKRLFKEVSTACKQIRSQRGFPVRVSISEIVNRVDCKKWIDKRREKLPKTAKVIDEKTESLEDFMIRKILWATERFIRDRIIPNQRQLQDRAVAYNLTTKSSPKVQNVIEESLERIKGVVSTVL